jgi:hypothetical protein
VVLPKSVAPRYEARTAPAPRSVTSISVRPAGAQQSLGRQAMNLSASSLY